MGSAHELCAECLNEEAGVGCRGDACPGWELRISRLEVLPNPDYDPTISRIDGYVSPEQEECVPP